MFTLETGPIDGIPDPHYHIHAFTFNATFDPKEQRWKAGEFGNIKRDAPFYEAAFHARLAEKLLENGFAIRRTDRDFEFASVSGELIEKFSKRTRLIEQLALERYTILEAKARDLVKKTGMDFADAFAQVKGKLGAESREAKSFVALDPQEQLANWRAQMTPEERASLKAESVKGTLSKNLLEGPIAKNLALEHLFERASVVRELHAAAMLLSRGIGWMSVEQARIFATTDDCFVWIDEAGFLSTRQMRWAVDFAARNDCRLILSGDTHQHHAVERGDAMRLMERTGAIAHVALTKIFRQQIAAFRDAVYDLSAGKTESGFSKLDAFGAIHEVEDNIERLGVLRVDVARTPFDASLHRLESSAERGCDASERPPLSSRVARRD